jgi:hypothetical protein
MKEKADTPEKKERHQDGVIRASRAMNQRNSIALQGHPDSSNGAFPHRIWLLRAYQASPSTFEELSWLLL